MKVDRYLDLTFALEVVLPVAGGLAGGSAWTPRAAGGVVGWILGYIVAYIIVEILDRLFLIYGDPERIDRELAKGRRERDERRRKKK
ncbi:MAG: hypothetical protein J0H06_01085 [Actinobacteria bacterium]|nr:hypothetical protein [Actinomycetota bacterium]